MLIKCKMSATDVDYIIIPIQTYQLDNCHQLIYYSSKENVFTYCTKKTIVSYCHSVFQMVIEFFIYNEVNERRGSDLFYLLFLDTHLCFIHA